MAKAGKPHGLGEILSDGYELTDHVVVDDDHTFDGNNEVIEKLITGFKTFKEGVFKYVCSVSTGLLYSSLQSFIANCS